MKWLTLILFGFSFSVFSQTLQTLKIIKVNKSAPVGAFTIFDLDGELNSGFNINLRTRECLIHLTWNNAWQYFEKPKKTDCLKIYDLINDFGSIGENDNRIIEINYTEGDYIYPALLRNIILKEEGEITQNIQLELHLENYKEN